MQPSLGGSEDEMLRNVDHLLNILEQNRSVVDAQQSEVVEHLQLLRAQLAESGENREAHLFFDRCRNELSRAGRRRTKDDLKGVTYQKAQVGRYGSDGSTHRGANNANSSDECAAVLGDVLMEVLAQSGEQWSSWLRRVATTVENPRSRSPQRSGGASSSPVPFEPPMLSSCSLEPPATGGSPYEPLAVGGVPQVAATKAACGSGFSRLPSAPVLPGQRRRSAAASPVPRIQHWQKVTTTTQVHTTSARPYVVLPVAGEVAIGSNPAPLRSLQTPTLLQTRKGSLPAGSCPGSKGCNSPQGLGSFAAPCGVLVACPRAS